MATALVWQLFLAATLFARSNCDAIIENNLYDINILHHNDFHAHYEETTPVSTQCRSGEGTCIGGLARLYTAVKELRDENSLLLNAGDTFQGTPWYNKFKWNITALAMNLLPHDAHTLGNHEFDDGAEGLIPYMELLRAPIVIANMNSSAVPAMGALYNKSIVIHKNGRKIGIVGVLIATVAEIGDVGNITFTDEIKAINEEVDKLVEQNVNIIIVLSHAGLDIDKHIAQKGSPHIDVIVGGHTHSLLYNGDLPDNFVVSGEYPVVIQRDGGHKILIVQSGSFCRFLGYLKLQFDHGGEIVSYEGNSIYLNSSIQQDQSVLQILAPFKKEIAYLNRDTYGDVLMTLDHVYCRFGECLLGDFACDAISNFYTETNADGVTCRPICLLSQGGFRSPIGEGPVTQADLKMLFPFGNNATTFELRGDYLLDTLEHSIGHWDFDQKYSEYLLQFSGLRVVYNVSKPVNHRVVNLEVACQCCDGLKYMPLNTEEYYKIVSNSFITGGGDGMIAISNNLINLKVEEIDTYALQEYIIHNSPVSIHLDKRIEIEE